MLANTAFYELGLWKETKATDCDLEKILRQLIVTSFTAKQNVWLCADAVLNSQVEGADEREVTKVMSAIADRVVHEFVEPFTFPSQHQRILEPYNYYEFGQVGGKATELSSPKYSNHTIGEGGVLVEKGKRVCP